MSLFGPEMKSIWVSESKCNLICCQTVPCFQLHERSDGSIGSELRHDHPHQSTRCNLSSVKIKDRNDASDLDWHERKKMQINISHKCLDSLGWIYGHVSNILSPSRSLHVIWQRKDSPPAQVSYSSTALSDLIYSITSVVASSSTLQCHHSMLDVSKEQNKTNYIGNPIPQVDQGRWIHTELQISHTITLL